MNLRPWPLVSSKAWLCPLAVWGSLSFQIPPSQPPLAQVRYSEQREQPHSHGPAWSPEP